MTGNYQASRLKNLLALADCPEDLQEAYLNFLQIGGQQVLIIQNKVSMMFQKEMKSCKRLHRPMEGTVTFQRQEEAPSVQPEIGLFIGIEFILSSFNNGIPARILDIERVHNETTQIVIGYGMTNLKLSLGKKRRL